MYEPDWLVCETPEPMLDFVGPGACDRKLRLFACGCVRRAWRLLADPRSRAAVEAAEAFADNEHLDPAAARRAAEEAVWASTGMARRSAARAAANTTGPEPRPLHYSPFRARQHQHDLIACVRDAALSAARALALCRSEAERQEYWADERLEQANLLRCVLGNPYAPVVLAPGWLTWRDGLVVEMAWAIYERHRFGDLPILADALEEAGCDDAAVLRHCREPGPHARGCHVLDAVLGHDEPESLCGAEWFRSPDAGALAGAQ